MRAINFNLAHNFPKIGLFSGKFCSFGLKFSDKIFLRTAQNLRGQPATVPLMIKLHKLQILYKNFGIIQFHRKLLSVG